jgi:hypothetical protein
MTVYMLRDKETGLYYRRTKGSYSPMLWVEQKKASIWTTKNGPAQVRGFPVHSKKHLVIVAFTLTEVK